MARTQFGSLSLDLPEGVRMSNVILTVPDPSGPADGSRFQPSVVVSAEAVPEGTEAEAFVQGQRQLLKQAGVPESSFGETRWETTSEGDRGLVSEQVVISPAQDRIRQIQFCVIRDGTAYLAVASHLDGAPFDRMRSTFERILLSFA